MASNQPKIMTHAVLGYPTVDKSIQLIEAMAAAGEDMIELQIPFSDPIADGPVILAANQVAVEQGVDVEQCLQMIGMLATKISVPLLIMCYYHSIFQFGVEEFCQRAAKVGVRGLIVPDLPPEEDAIEGLTKYSRQHNLQVIKVVSPGMTEERLRAVARGASGFVYCTARVGITGARTDVHDELFTFIKKVKAIFTLPVAVGFGINNRAQVQAVTQQDCMSVVGSQLLTIYNDEGVAGVKKFIKELKS